MSRLCRLKSYANIGDDGKWAYAEISRLTLENTRLKAAIERMRVSGGSAEFHRAFELAKDLLAELKEKDSEVS